MKWQEIDTGTVLGCPAPPRGSRYRLQAFSGVSEACIRIYEKAGKLIMPRQGDADSRAAIRAALEAGVGFMNGDEPGVKLKRQPE